MNSSQLKLVPSSDQKRCPMCKLIKPISEYCSSKVTKDGLCYECKVCHSERNKKDRERYKERYRQKKKIYTQLPETKKRAREKTWANYGIKNADGSAFKIHDYEVMFAQQNQRCAICLKDEIGNKRTEHFFVDHDHKTGKVRWLLCNFCNHLLASAKDNPDILERASKMLREKQ